MAKKIEEKVKRPLTVWTVKLEEAWSNDAGDGLEDNGREYIVVSHSIPEAEEKALRLAFGASYEDDGGNTVKLVRARVYEVLRLLELDA